MKKPIYIAAIVLLLLVFGVSAFMVGSYLLEGKEQTEKYDSLAALKDSAKENATTATESTEETDPEGTFREAEVRDENGMLVEYGEIYALNEDVVGWIRMDGTEMDYPVMQTSTDNANFYLYRDFDKKQSARGSIYIREECDMNEPSDNITIYGHNMRDGSMFECLNDYVSKEAWDNNALIFFDSLYEYRVYKIFAVFKTSANVGKGFTYHNMIDAKDKADFDEFISTCKQLSFYETGITPEYGDKIICLSTCEYTLDNGRLVVAAVRIS